MKGKLNKSYLDQLVKMLLQKNIFMELFFMYHPMTTALI